MSLETENRPETEGERAVRLFEEIGRAGAKAQQARQVFKAETATAEAILGNQEHPLSLHYRARALGTMILAKAAAEIEAKETRSKNMEELRALLMPNDEPRPIVTITALAPDAIARSYISPNRVDGETIGAVSGIVDSIGEFSFMIRADDEAYNIFPTAFLTGDTKITINIERPVYEEAVAA